jgi:integrase
MQAGVLEAAEVTRILSIKGYRHAEGVHLDETRTKSRTGHKKATPVSIPVGYVHLLKSRHDTRTAIGRRDKLLMCLLLDLGLRCGEIALLRVEHLDLAAGTLSFYRPKVDLVQTHMLPPDTLEAARLYLETDKPTGMLFAGTGREDKKTPGISTRTINARVRTIGERLGLRHLSPHDCRHAWATHATRLGNDVKRLQDAGGWKSPYMALRYAESSRIANEGVKLPRL